ncbi:hypothetical protein [Lentibacillus sediminis]|uniref:hypothetical protein n=1 Tax=Lentibacillus sediminis TaxID=1940529 RepID=UPI000C1C5BA0|nr:hypothetical protein [Lentibacillus sediminis]
MPNQNKRKSNVNSYTTADLLSDRNLEIIAAALLVTGKLRIDYVSIYRDEPAIDVLLTGAFLQPNSKNKNMDQMAKFLKENGNMTVDDIIGAINQRLNE